MVEAGGCSAKLSPKALGLLISQVKLPDHPDIIIGAETHDDAGVIRRPSGEYLIQTTDFFPPMVDDPYQFGQVAAANALSDIYAMGGRPISALNLVMFPSGQLDSEILVEVLKGGQSKIEEAGCLLLGGHTIDDSPLKYGLAVTGEARPDELVTNAAARPGDILLLTKALGTAILTGARKVDLIGEAEVEPAIRSMISLNDKASELMVKHGVLGATDVTGFGLLGHAYRFADASDVTFRIESQNLPQLPGALELISRGAIPGGAMRNLEFVREQSAFLPSLDADLKWLALDPQTSGGLLMAVNSDKVDGILADLQAAGIGEACIVGQVMAPGEKRLLIA